MGIKYDEMTPANNVNTLAIQIGEFSISFHTGFVPIFIKLQFKRISGQDIPQLMVNRSHLVASTPPPSSKNNLLHNCGC